MSPVRAGQLHFAFLELLEEIRFVEKAAKPLLEASAEQTLKQYRTLLTSIQQSRTSGVLTIDVASPIVTKPSDGHYDKGKGNPVFAEIASIWEVSCIPEAKRSMPCRHLVVTGLASTVVRLVEGSSRNRGRDLATWKMELGAPDAPGCYFHSHIGSPIPVPRLPILPVSPMAVVEFVLGELFQEHWERLAAEESHEQTRWRIVQSHRLEAFADWQKSAVARTTGSPWVTLKKAMPPADIFIKR